MIKNIIADLSKCTVYSLFWNAMLHWDVSKFWALVCTLLHYWLYCESWYPVHNNGTTEQLLYTSVHCESRLLFTFNLALASAVLSIEPISALFSDQPMNIRCNLGSPSYGITAPNDQLDVSTSWDGEEFVDFSAVWEVLEQNTTTASETWTTSRYTQLNTQIKFTFERLYPIELGKQWLLRVEQFFTQWPTVFGISAEQWSLKSSCYALLLQDKMPLQQANKNIIKYNITQ